MKITGKIISKMLLKAIHGLEELDDLINSSKDAIHASPNSPERLEPPPRNLNIDMSNNFFTIPFVLKYGYKIKPRVKSILTHLTLSYKSIEMNPIEPCTTTSESFIKEFENYAKELNINHIGYTKIRPELIFKGKSVLFEGVIVLTMEMNEEEIAKVPHPEGLILFQDVYAKLGEATTKLTEFLREKGYGAQAGHPASGLSNYVQLAIDSGIGWMGNHRMLITPELGTRQRISVIYTSINNLPYFTGENPHRWIEEQCKHCKKCIRNCLGKAIVEHKNNENGSVTHVDTVRCYNTFLKNYACGKCIKECPFSNKLYDKLKLIHENR